MHNGGSLGVEEIGKNEGKHAASHEGSKSPSRHKHTQRIGSPVRIERRISHKDKQGSENGIVVALVPRRVVWILCRPFPRYYVYVSQVRISKNLILHIHLVCLCVCVRVCACVCARARARVHYLSLRTPAQKQRRKCVLCIMSQCYPHRHGSRHTRTCWHSRLWCLQSR